MKKGVTFATLKLNASAVGEAPIDRVVPRAATRVAGTGDETFGRYGISIASVRLVTSVVGLSARYIRCAVCTARSTSAAARPIRHSSIFRELKTPMPTSASITRITMVISSKVKPCGRERDVRDDFMKRSLVKMN